MSAITTPGRALVVGATGIVGQATSQHLAAGGWEAFGLSRSGGGIAGVTAVRADLADPAQLATALEGTAPELVVITAWSRQATEAENIAVNGAAVRNLLAALRSFEH